MSPSSVPGSLASREIPLAEVGCRLGYSDPSAFHRAFRRWSGMTPLEYRRAVKAGAHAPPGELPGR